jgi:hypothetical protein
MNESYSYSSSLKNNYISLDVLCDIIKDLDDVEADIFSDIDSMQLSPSQDTMNKIYAYL